MSRRCLICDNVNPCRKHSYDQQDAELARNDRAIRELKAIPEAPMTDTLDKTRASEALGGWMSAALDDPAVCDAMKTDIQAWFDAGKPPYSDTLERREAIETLTKFAERLKVCPDDTPDIAYASIESDHGEVRAIRAAITALSLPAREVRGERAQIEHECADLIARYFRREIGRLMHQAEHWAENGKPLATHDRLHKADAYFQIVALMEREPAKGWKPPFDEIRDHLARQPINPPGAYPPSADLHRYRDAPYVAALATTPAPREKLEADLAEAKKALEPFADAGEYMDLETDGFMPGDKLHVAYEDHVIFDGLKFGDFELARATLNRLSGEG